jgi:transposase
MQQKETAADFRRRRAVDLIAQGESRAIIAKVLDVSLASLSRWYKIYRSGESLKTKHIPGCPPKLSPEQIETLRDLLVQGAMAHGWPNNLWTTKRIAEVIRIHFKVELSRSQISRILKQQMNWSVQRPTQQVRERNEDVIRQWKEVEFARIARDAYSRNACLVFLDEAGFMLSPTSRCTFAPRGVTPVIQVSDPHGRISVAGALVVSPERKCLRFLYRLLPDNVNFRGDSLVEFIREICKKIPGPIVLIWDGIPIHCSEAVKRYLERRRRVTVEQFPAYAPELNPVDNIWLYIKYDCLANYAPPTLDELRHRLIHELTALQGRSDVLFWCVKETGLCIDRSDLNLDM